MSIEKKLKELKSLFDKGLLEEDVYLQKQKEILDQGVESDDLIDNSQENNYSNEYFLNTLGGSVYFKNDLIGHNRLQGFHCDVKSFFAGGKKPMKKYLNPNKIREITRYDSFLKGNTSLHAMYFLPEQKPLKGERGAFEYKKNVDYPSISQILSNLGNENKLFKNDPDEVDGFVLQIFYKDIDYINTYQIDTSEIKGLSNFMGRFTNSDTLTRKQFDPVRFAELKAKGTLYKNSGQTEVSVECNYLINFYPSYYSDYKKYYGSKLKEISSKKYLVSELNRFFTIQWTMKNTSQLRDMFF
jgi:hypothetical protein